MDLMEELRPHFADRLAVTLVNRRQVTSVGFVVKENGAVIMEDGHAKGSIDCLAEKEAGGNYASIFGSEVFSLLVLITYDVNVTTEAGKRRLRRVAKQCVNHGQRVQNSVFECLLDPAQFAELRHRLEKIIDQDTDSLRYYFLGKNWKSRVEHVGAKAGYDPEGILMV